MSDWKTSWEPLGAVEPGRLAAARWQLHVAAQAVSAVGKSLLAAPPDDSNQAFAWLPQARALAQGVVDGKTAVRAALQPATLTAQLLAADGTTLAQLPLAGRTVEAVYTWLYEQLPIFLGMRLEGELAAPADIGKHPLVDAGATFEADPAALAELERYLVNAHLLLTGLVTKHPGASPVRLWPHHLDIASLVVLDPHLDSESARSVGIGMAPGDGSYEQPYLYLTPWPYPEQAKQGADALPSLPAGHWHTEGWVGAVLTGDELLGATDPDGQGALAERFVRSAMTSSLALLGDG